MRFAGLLLVVLAATACRSRSEPPRENAPPPVTTIASAKVSDSSAAPLLRDDPSFTRTERIARVLSVAPCGKKDGMLCERLTIKNEGKVDIAAVDEIRLCAYDAKGFPTGTNGYNYEPTKPLAIKAGTTVVHDQLVPEDEKYTGAKIIEAEIVIARLAGAPKGSQWLNANLAADDRPKGGFGAKALEERSRVFVRALAWKPVPGIVRVRNETKLTIREIAIQEYGWKHGAEGVLERVGGLSFGVLGGWKLDRPLAPGEERDIDLSGGKTDRFVKPDLVARTVVVSGVQYTGDNEWHWNANIDYAPKTRPAEDLRAR